MATDANRRQPRPTPMPGDHSWMDLRWYSLPADDPLRPEIYLYTDAQSYPPGSTVSFHASTHAPSWQVEISREGSVSQVVHRAMDLPGRFSATPADAYRSGCGWPSLHSWTIPHDARSGFYRVRSSCLRPDGTRFEQDHFFVVRPASPLAQERRPGRVLMMIPTATYMAYNDWGGANHYMGSAGDGADQSSAVLSAQRPWTRGIVWQPSSSPRLCTPERPFGEAPRYGMKEWAYANGYGFFCHAAGWAQFDRHFAAWAEREGYELDMITQQDLHYRPELLSAYPCVVVVGHDEYWSHEMRTHMERYVFEGGHFARFGANFYWQIRLEDEGATQVCYKTAAPQADPVRLTGDTTRLTTAWEDRSVAWPGATTVGVNGLGGMYASWGGYVARGTRGFTVYRPDHWVFAGTELGYGDIFGAEARIFGYEVDGLDYTVRDGLPYSTGEDGAPDTVEILAMSPAVLAEQVFDHPGFRNYASDVDQRQKAAMRYDGPDASSMAKSRYGAGMLVHMPRGKGEVLTAATCEWVMGLALAEPFTCRITRNVLDRFLTPTTVETVAR